MDNAHSMEIVDSIQDLANQSAGIFFCVKSFLHYPIKQLSTGYTVVCLFKKKKKRTNKKFEGTCEIVQGKPSIRDFNMTREPNFISKINSFSDLYFAPSVPQKLYQGSVSVSGWYGYPE